MDAITLHGRRIGALFSLVAALALAPSAIAQGETGTTVGITPESMDFGKRGVKQASPVQTLKLTAPSDSPARIRGVVSGDFSASPDHCDLDKGASCAVNVAFKPQQTGLSKGSITVTSDKGPAHVVALTGVGECVATIRTFWRRADLSGAASVIVLALLYLIALILVRWHLVARPTQSLLAAQIEAVRARVSGLQASSSPAPAGLVSIANLLETATGLAKGKGGAYIVADFLFWSRGNEIAAWGVIHEAEEQLSKFLAPDDVRAALAYAAEVARDRVIELPQSV